MTRTNIILQLLVMSLYILIQVFFFEDVMLFDKAFCFIYIGFILLLPVGISSLKLLLFAFFSGLAVDIFFNSLGIHASSTLLLAFIRPFWISMITPRGGYDEVYTPTIRELNLGWFTSYTVPLIIVHHFSLFYIDAGGFGNGWYTFSKVLSSAAFTYLIIVIIQMFFYPRRRAI